MPPWNESSEAMLMIFPPSPRSIIWRPAARQRRNALDRLTAITSSQNASLCSAAGWRRMMPALLTTMSMRPKRSTVSATSRPAEAVSRQIRGEQFRATAASLRDEFGGGCRRRRAGVQRDLRAGTGQRQRHGGAKAAGCARDQRHLAVEPEQIEGGGHRLVTVPGDAGAESLREAARRCRSARPPRRASSRRAGCSRGTAAHRPPTQCGRGHRR